MPHTSIVGAIAIALAAGFVTGAVAQPPSPEVMPPPPDYALGLQRQLDAALTDGSNGALIMFIARNPTRP